MTLSPKNIGVLVQKAYCLEVLADKNNCTSRFVDLPGKPLEDFILAAINIGPVFENFVATWNKGKRGIYSHYRAGLKASQQHKSDKFINFGLLEIGFPAVAARLSCNDPKKVISKIVSVMKAGDMQDVENMIAARKLAWTSSTKSKLKLSELTPYVRQANNPYDFYMRILETPALGSSAYQWSKQYKQGLPWLKSQFDYLQKTKGPLLERVENAFDPVYAANPDAKIGILADMSAAAIFLHFSYN